ncbi:MAG: hypothetical protein A3J48_04245 [Candidatus Doudnabacteria bacterium RIFCSPHIGHO2_02_FULL_46_11]|uniref:Uncharacterized protein n=1 Tax=Candidatus Doudnabacteria bacterium RIFCSPHIGHO2_02_FULL_46_11 TaxID=1817832 RepID=A0A1F5P4J3_9BACT|nr:MAG: hypothetical protein A3J48_04245 [Candidatus Doudnabacteria bacterium RIFCSPHIGHO2_02_FULL_46_11]
MGYNYAPGSIEPEEKYVQALQYIIDHPIAWNMLHAIIVAGHGTHLVSFGNMSDPAYRTMLGEMRNLELLAETRDDEDIYNCALGRYGRAAYNDYWRLNQRSRN